ncbi:MAG: hypothetical protein KC910_09330 [Candidatus Eremiobacteraeota bacterium]|nr:hypothetical protein [Candidatus Eremiobacteraeota bacterium]
MKIGPKPVSHSANQSRARPPLEDGPVELFERRRFYLPGVMSPYHTVDTSQADQRLADGHTLFTRLGETFAPVATPGDLAALMAFHGLAADPPPSAENLIELGEHGVEMSLTPYQAYLQTEHRWPETPAQLDYHFDGLALDPSELTELEQLKRRAADEPVQVLRELYHHCHKHQQSTEALAHLPWQLPQDTRKVFLECAQRAGDPEVMDQLAAGDFGSNATMFLSFGLVPGKNPDSDLAAAARQQLPRHSAESMASLNRALQASRLTQAEQLQRFQLLEQLQPAQVSLLTKMVETGFDAEHTEKFLKRLEEPVGATRLDERVQAFGRLIKIDDLKAPLNQYAVMEALYSAYASRADLAQVEQLRDVLLTDADSLKDGLEYCTAHPDSLATISAQLEAGWAYPWAQRAYEKAPDHLDTVNALLEPLKERRLGDAGVWIELAGSLPEPASRQLLVDMAKVGYDAKYAEQFSRTLSQPPKSSTVAQEVDAFRQLLKFDDLKAPLNQYAVMEELLATYRAEIEVGRSPSQALERTVKLRDAFTRGESFGKEGLAIYRKEMVQDPGRLEHLLAFLQADVPVDFGVKLATLLKTPPPPEHLTRLTAGFEKFSIQGNDQTVFAELYGHAPETSELALRMVETGFAAGEAKQLMDKIDSDLPDTTLSERVQAFTELIQMDDLKSPLNQYKVMHALYDAYAEEAKAGHPDTAKQNVLTLSRALQERNAQAAEYETVFGQVKGKLAETVPKLAPLLGKGWDIAFASKAVDLPQAGLDALYDSFKELGEDRLSFIELLTPDPARIGLLTQMAKPHYSADKAKEFVELLEKPQGTTTFAQRGQDFAAMLGLDDLKPPFNAYAVMEAAYGAYSQRLEAGLDRQAVNHELQSMREAFASIPERGRDVAAAYKVWGEHPQVNPADLARLVAGGAKCNLDSDQIEGLLGLLAKNQGTALAELSITMAEHGFSAQAAGEIQEQLSKPVGKLELDARVRAYQQLVEYETLPSPLNEYAVMKGLYSSFAGLVGRRLEPEQALTVVTAARDGLRNLGGNQLVSHLASLESVEDWSPDQVSWFAKMAGQGQIEGAVELVSSGADPALGETYMAVAGSPGLAGALCSAHLALSGHGQSEADATAFLTAIVSRERARGGSDESIAESVKTAVNLFVSTRPRTNPSLERDEEKVVIGDFNVPVQE